MLKSKALLKSKFWKHLTVRILVPCNLIFVQDLVTVMVHELFMNSICQLMQDDNKQKSAPLADFVSLRDIFIFACSIPQCSDAYRKLSDKFLITQFMGGGCRKLAQSWQIPRHARPVNIVVVTLIIVQNSMSGSLNPSITRVKSKVRFVRDFYYSKLGAVSWVKIVNRLVYGTSWSILILS